jgi:hypothetical protein
LDQNDDTVAEKIISEQVITITERVGLIKLLLPAQQQVIVRITQKQAMRQKGEAKSDVAITNNDLAVSDVSALSGLVQIKGTLHNIGNAASSPTMAYLNINGSVVDSCVVESIEAPNDLHPRTKSISFGWKPTNGAHQITVSVKSNQQEINSNNNFATVSYHYPTVKKSDGND